MSRERRADRLAVSDSVETGTALRWVSDGARGLMHVAIVGTSEAELARAVAAASVAVNADMGMLAEEVPSERLDLELPVRAPDEVEIPEGVVRLELGWTTEVLVGSAGWNAVRTRARSSALLSGGSRLVARRGFGAVSAAVEPAREVRGESLLLAPGAAAAVVARLTHIVHGPAPELGREVGRGWVVDDEPQDARGLAGGVFDDAGFPTRRRALATDGRLVGGIDGAGCYWRRSFRDPPSSLPSNLVIAGAIAESASPIDRIEECRVLPLGRREWVLEIPGRRPSHVRVDPMTLLERCVGTVGEPETTAEGVITPALLFRL